MIFNLLRRWFNRASCDGIRIVESPEFKQHLANVVFVHLAGKNAVTTFTLYEMSTGKTYSVVVSELDDPPVMVIEMVDVNEEVR